MASRYNSDLPLYFLHIPKTAGSSMSAMLTTAFKPAEICPAMHWDYIAQLAPESLSTYRVFAGHFSAYLSRFLGRELNIFTLLRDPVERTLSLYGYVLREPTHPLFKVVSNLTLREFIFDSATRPKIWNFRARYIADLGLDPRSMAPRFASHDPTHYGFQMSFDDSSASASPKALRDAALLALDSFFFVGTTEHFNASVPSLSGQIGVNLTIPERLNVTQTRIQRQDIDPETLASIEEATTIDRELYEIIQDRLQAGLGQTNMVESAGL
jgi:hypothetical protein